MRTAGTEISFRHEKSPLKEIRETPPFLRSAEDDSRFIILPSRSIIVIPPQLYNDFRLKSMPPSEDSTALRSSRTSVGYVFNHPVPRGVLPDSVEFVPLIILILG